MKLLKVSRERRQTLSFLAISRGIPAITVMREIDVSRIVAGGLQRSMTAITIKAISEALRQFPQLNAMIRFGSDSTLICPDNISTRVTLEKALNGVSGVYSRVISNTDRLSVADIERALRQFKQEDAATSEHYEKIRFIQRLPPLLAGLLLRLAMLSPRRQAETWGSFTVTSLGKNSPDACIPISGSTFTFTLGLINEKLSRNSHDVAMSHVANLSMIFDHRVLDGRLASEFLAQIKSNMEGFALESSS
ncbi:2-oxo acid dehydrogenase subunit E2 [Dickeya fangzhongdai]|uniref:2-oxo acid dehydrogenase subunit E2 n=1 Tax=Dickeya fangzhongdai TaxID=1778540 RepID=UPI0004F702F3|nr:2-oxo acid dehydrogenase subunit E2 [Dickeya fangzhongdai]AIR68250.1 dihydrolipoamide succinyltransferase [Dickeya fangzhongdai]KGT96267.1 dihydrolipoamide succinyltransferase [Dickeya fangzhongdai]KHN56958.1 dihydrolipoamide succinyltransferase [Dickeya fangzhongdai]